MSNPLSGLRSPGCRFRLRHNALSHRALYLPLEMKHLPQIQRIIKGESFLEVFNATSIDSARRAFDELRNHFDFAFWAAREYYVRDINDADNIIPLRLNDSQHKIIDTFQRRRSDRQFGRYIITKTVGRVGLTTCVQAYILWLQTYCSPKHSFTCQSSDISINPLKTNLCRYLHRDIVPTTKFIFLPSVNRTAFFNTYRNPDYIRGIDLGYVHFADMSRWHDPDGEVVSRVVAAATSSVLLRHDTLVVLEGNIPGHERFRIEKYQCSSIPFGIRLMRLAHLTKNPFFLDHLAMSSLPDSPSPYTNIPL